MRSFQEGYIEESIKDTKQRKRCEECIHHNKCDSESFYTVCEDFEKVRHSDDGGKE